MIVHVTVKVSSAALLTVEKTVLHNIVPDVAALNIHAYVIATVASPDSKADT